MVAAQSGSQTQISRIPHQAVSSTLSTEISTSGLIRTALAALVLNLHL
jgi:hypothetical protein